MKLPHHILRILKNKNGYTMIAVLCVFLVFLVLGGNALVAAHAAVGTTAKKQNDAQAYALANSALTRVSTMIEAGDFSVFIQKNVMDSINTAFPSGSVGSGFDPDAYGATAEAELTLPNQTEPALIRVTFTMSNVTFQSVTAPSGKVNKVVTGLLTAHITAIYRQSEYSFFADYQQFVDPADATNMRWRLRSFRNDRIPAQSP